jgi:hypothetical protein
MKRPARVLDVAPPPAVGGPVAGESVRRRAAEAAAGYALVILAVSWVLKPIREFFVTAGADPVLANLSQAVATLLILTFAAGWVVRAFGVPARLDLRLALGLGGVALFAAGDALTSLLLFGQSPFELVAEFKGPKGLVLTLMLAIAAALPAVRGRSNEA